MSLPKFREKSTSPFFRLFLLRKLPLAFIAGVKVVQFDEEKCTTKLKFSWINQNPFRSMYFAAMQMAAELTTGLLLYQYVAEGLKFSMLLVSINSEYVKKAIGTIHFTCNQSNEMERFIETLKNEPDGVEKIFTVLATDEQGNEVAKFEIKWSCKTK